MASVYFVAGQLGGMVGVITGQPFDTVKLKMQTARTVRHIYEPYQVISLPKYARVRDAVSAMFAKEGIPGFFRGISSPLVAVGTLKSLAFGINNNMRVALQGDKPELSMADLVLCGLTTGFATSFLCCPIEQLKIALQVQNGSNGLWACGVQLRQNHGSLRSALFGGYAPVAIREIVGLGIYFSSYEAIRRFLYKDVFGSTALVASQFLAGGIAGTVMWASYYPLDILKSTIQVQNAKYLKGNSSGEKVMSMREAVAKLRRTSGFYRGMAPAVMRAFPAHASLFVTYETCLRFMLPEERTSR